MAYFGIDIGSYAIKIVASEGSGAGAKIKRIGSVHNPVGQVLPSDKTQFEQLAGTIKTLVKDKGLTGKNCHLALPGQQAYVSIINMPILSDAELASAIKWEAEQHIPVSMDEVNFEYDVVYRPDKNSIEDEMSVFLVGAPKKVVERYLELLELAGVEAIGLEPEVLSILRAFFPDTSKGAIPTLISNVGALSSSFVIVDELGRVGVAHSAPLGSLALTRALEKGLSLQPAQAEQYKRTYGLDQDKLEGKVRIVLLPVFDALVREIRKTIQFYISKNPGSNKVNRLIITGGGAHLPGIAAYLAEVLSLEVLVGNPLEKFKNESEEKINEVSSYAVALGLSIKEF